MISFYITEPLIRAFLVGQFEEIRVNHEKCGKEVEVRINGLFENTNDLLRVRSILYKSILFRVSTRSIRAVFISAIHLLHCRFVRMKWRVLKLK